MTDEQKNEWNNALAWLPAKVSAVKTALKVFYNTDNKGSKLELYADLQDILDARKELDNLLNFLTDAAKEEEALWAPKDGEE